MAIAVIAERQKMMMTSGDIRQLSGLTEKALRGLRDRGAINKPGAGHGHHLNFTMPELVALAYGARLSSIGYGAVVGDVVRYLASFSEKKLLAEFRKGHTYLLPVPGMMRLTRPPCQELMGSPLDMEATYNELILAIQKIARDGRRKPRIGAGRQRGLTVK